MEIQPIRQEWLGMNFAKRVRSPVDLALSTSA